MKHFYLILPDNDAKSKSKNTMNWQLNCNQPLLQFFLTGKQKLTGKFFPT
jgi:hypothetical protein